MFMRIALFLKKQNDTTLWAIGIAVIAIYWAFLGLLFPNAWIPRLLMLACVLIIWLFYVGRRSKYEYPKSSAHLFAIASINITVYAVVIASLLYVAMRYL